MKISNLIFVAAIFSAFLTGSVQADESFEINTARPGSSYRHFELSEADPTLCKKACEGEFECQSWTYVTQGIQANKAVCWLKNDIPQSAYNRCCISGIKDVSTIYKARVQMRDRRLPTTTYLSYRDMLDEQGVLLEKEKNMASFTGDLPLPEGDNIPIIDVLDAASRGDIEILGVNRGEKLSYSELQTDYYQEQQVQSEALEQQPVLQKVVLQSVKIPIAHVWEYLKHFGREPEGYAAYSYILTGRNGSNKYAELVKRIQHSTLSAGEVAESKTFLPDELNIFLIPAINTEGSMYKPDYEVSKNLLAVLGARSKLRFDRPGPFIITLYRPISSISRNTREIDMLYVDLTNVNTGAIAELVRTYKNSVLEEKLDGMQKLKSLRLSILNLAFMTEESLGFAKAAYAEMHPIVFGR